MFLFSKIGDIYKQDTSGIGTYSRSLCLPSIEGFIKTKNELRVSLKYSIDSSRLEFKDWIIETSLLTNKMCMKLVKLIVNTNLQQQNFIRKDMENKCLRLRIIL